MNIPLFDAQREYNAYAPELEEAALRALRSGRYILGPEVAAFEREAASYLDVGSVIGCANGTDALWLALRALDIGPGDIVLTSTFTFFATASAILATGATPAFCDIDAVTFNIDPSSMAAALAGKLEPLRRVGVDPSAIKAIIPIHLYGQSADMDPIMEIARTYGVPVIEDAAQAIGTTYRDVKVGGIGDLGCFSMFPTKNLGAFGDAGFVSTNNTALANRIRLLRAHGSSAKYKHDIAGTNSRLDEVQAAMLRVRLTHLDEMLARRIAIASAYDAVFDSSPVVSPPRASYGMHTFHAYNVRVPSRDAVREALTQASVGTSVYYETPLHLQRAAEHLGYREDDFPVAEEASREVLALPVFPTLADDEVGAVSSTLLDVYANNALKASGRKS